MVILKFCWNFVVEQPDIDEDTVKLWNAVKGLGYFVGSPWSTQQLVETEKSATKKLEKLKKMFLIDTSSSKPLLATKINLYKN